MNVQATCQIHLTTTYHKALPTLGQRSGGAAWETIGAESRLPRVAETRHQTALTPEFEENQGLPATFSAFTRFRFRKTGYVAVMTMRLPDLPTPKPPDTFG